MENSKESQLLPLKEVQQQSEFDSLGEKMRYKMGENMLVPFGKCRLPVT